MLSHFSALFPMIQPNQNVIWPPICFEPLARTGECNIAQRLSENGQTVLRSPLRSYPASLCVALRRNYAVVCVALRSYARSITGNKIGPIPPISGIRFNVSRELIITRGRGVCLQFIYL